MALKSEHPRKAEEEYEVKWNLMQGFTFRSTAWVQISAAYSLFCKQYAGYTDVEKSENLVEGT